MSAPVLSYIKRDTPIHALSGATKLAAFLMWSVTGMATLDARVLLSMLLLAGAVFAAARIRFKEVAFVLALIGAFLTLNMITIFLFAPEHGVELYGTRHVIVHIAGRYTLTWEQVFYELTVLLKYFTVTPLAVLFLTTTDPSEFASSLSRLKVSYRVAYAVALALRYIPDVQRDFFEISHAQQARGLSIGRDVPLHKRLVNAVGILFPLIMVSLSRIDTIANAMELRGFGKQKKRTWYAAKPMKKADVWALALSACVCAAAFAFMALNGGRFFNPFK